MVHVVYNGFILLLFTNGLQSFLSVSISLKLNESIGDLSQSLRLRAFGSHLACPDVLFWHQLEGWLYLGLVFLDLDGGVFESVSAFRGGYSSCWYSCVYEQLWVVVRLTDVCDANFAFLDLFLHQEIVRSTYVIVLVCLNTLCCILYVDTEFFVHAL